MEVPSDLISKIRELITKHEAASPASIPLSAQRLKEIQSIVEAHEDEFKAV